MRSLAVGLCVLGTALLSACSSTNATPPESTGSIAARVQSHCTDIAAPELGLGTLCIDNGFRMKRDNFSFANWGRSQRADDNVTAQTLIDLFGYDTVCAPGDVSECLLRPSAVQLLDLWNTALAGGRCEGLAALSTRLFMSLDHPEQFGAAYSRPTDMTRRDTNVNQAVVYWWATQFINEVSNSARDSRRKSPLMLVDELIQGLAHSLGYTLGLYFESQGHSVTPFAVTNRDENFVVHVYDNNFPNRRREILVNKMTDTWTYRDASTSIDGSPIDWSGGKGTFELTSMSSRQGPFTCPFCRVVTEDSPTLVSLASRDANNPGYLRIDSRQGTAELSARGFTSTIEGASLHIGKGAGGLITIELPATLADFDISVTKSLSEAPAGDVILSVDRPGFPRLQIEGNLARGVGVDTAAPTVIARKKNTSVVAPTDASVRLSMSRFGTLITQDLEPSEEVLIKKESTKEIEISVKGSLSTEDLQIPLATNTTSERTEIIRMSDDRLAVRTVQPTSVRSSPARVINFVPRDKRPPQTTTTTSTSPPSIEISDPD